MFDCHVHTSFSTDCNMKIEEAIASSNKKDIGLIITEHMDLNYPVPEEFVFDIDKYFERYNGLKTDRLLLGIELGMDTNITSECRKISRREFDFIIGSVHILNGFDIYGGELYEGKNKSDVFEHYFKYMINCLEDFNFIDSLGHIDFISRYANYPDREIYYEDYSDLIDEVLKILVRNEKSIEINTRRFDDKRAVNNLLKIYKRFYELGGRTVTVGSDSHSPNFVGNNLKLGYEMAERCLLKPVFYKERKINYLD